MCKLFNQNSPQHLLWRYLAHHSFLQAEFSNKRNRPIGIGVQGLADAFILMRYPFDSEEAQELNKLIFETMYYASLKMSCQLAKEEGPYETFEGSPVSKGVSVCIVFIAKLNCNSCDMLGILHRHIEWKALYLANAQIVVMKWLY